MNEEEIKNINYFKKKLKSLNVTHDVAIFEGIHKLLEEIEDHLTKLKKDDLYAYKVNFIPIIESLKDEIDFCRNQPKPQKVDTRNFNERAYSKLNYIFRKQGLLSDKETRLLYQEYDYLLNKYNLFLDLINWLNDNGLSIIPEKTLFSAYLGISVETYNDILKQSTNSNVKNLFKSIDEYLTTNQFGALINDDRKALERIQKTETYGQEMRQTQPDTYIDNSTKLLSYTQLMQNITKKTQNRLLNDVVEIKE